MNRRRAEYGPAVPMQDADKPDWARPASIETTVLKTPFGEIVEQDGRRTWRGEGEIRSMQGGVVRTHEGTTKWVDDGESLTWTDPSGTTHKVRRTVEEHRAAIRRAGRTGMTEHERIIRGAESKSKALADRKSDDRVAVLKRYNLEQEARIHQLEQELARVHSKYRDVVENAGGFRMREVEQGRQRTTPSRAIYISSAIGWGTAFVSTLFTIFF